MGPSWGIYIYNVKAAMGSHLGGDMFVLTEILSLSVK